MKRMKRKMSRLQKREWIVGIAFLMPNFIGFALFLAVPVVMGVIISLTNYDGFFTFDFVGLQNYVKAIQDPFFRTALLNNIIYTAVSVPLTIFLALLIALGLNRELFGSGAFKTVYYFPTITSMVAIGIIWSVILNPTRGPLNQLLFGMGIDNPPQWLMSSQTALLSIIMVVVWKSCGYYMIMFMGGLKNIPRHLYEAADMDGANAWQKFKNITFPMLSPITFMVTILCIIDSFKVFDIINIMTKGGPGRSTNVLVYRIYQEAFSNSQFGYASAMAYYLFAIIMVITLIQFQGQKKWVNY